MHRSFSSSSSFVSVRIADEENRSVATPGKIFNLEVSVSLIEPIRIVTIKAAFLPFSLSLSFVSFFLFDRTDADDDEK